MGKHRNRDREFSKVQRLVNENKKLKRNIDQLRKELGRLNLDDHQHIKEVLEQQDMEDRQEELQREEEKLRKTWACKECNDGTMEIIQYSKLDGLWYYRQCSCCPNRTKGQRFTQEVKGIFKSPNPSK